MNHISHGVTFICMIIHCSLAHPQSIQKSGNYLILQEDSSTNSPFPTLPPLASYVDYGEECNPQAVIFLKKVCKTYERTVACKGTGIPLVPGKCECNLGEDAEFHETWGLCVSKVDALCFLNENALGRKVCVENADCFADQEGPGHNVGRCHCLHGFMEDTAGHCVVNPDVPEEDRSTVRPTTPFPTRAPPAVTGETSVSTPEDETPSTTGSGSGSAAAIQFTWSSLLLICITAVSAILHIIRF